MIFSSTRVTAYIICQKHSFFLFLTGLEVSLVTQLFRLSKVRKKAKSRVWNERVLGNFSKQFTSSKADIKKENQECLLVFEAM